MKVVQRFRPYTGPAAGWGALLSVTKHWVKSGNAVKNLRALLAVNQGDGFDCPGCAWGESAERGMVRFCENGAKAVNWEATNRHVGPEFFRRYSVHWLSRQSDFWLESQGRLTHPVRFDAASGHYIQVSWDEAFSFIAQRLRELESPDQAEFYTSGRASNEAAFLYQLFVRAFGTNNFPDCSNMCHEASAIGMFESLGVGKGTVTLEDFSQADAVIVMGQNPGTNHPRMLETLREVVARGGQVIVFNPLKERGLERFQHPQHPIEMLRNGSRPTSTAYFQPSLGGDMAAIRGVAKLLLEWERSALALNSDAVFDRSFIDQHTSGIQDYLHVLDSTTWDQILASSGLAFGDIEAAARVYQSAGNIIVCWAMGLTQHAHSVAIIQEVINLQLMTGNMGRAGAGVCPVRGHSNVQGDRTMGINEIPPEWFLNAIESRFQFSVPRHAGHNTVQAIKAFEEGRAKIFMGLGGNFAQATPDTQRTHAALRNCEMTVHISTKLNRSHLVTGKHAYILPCLGRTEIDMQASGPQGVTVEDTFSMVHLSQGPLRPQSPELRSEPAIVAGIAQAVLGNHPIDWMWAIEDYSRIRELISDVIPGFADFNIRLKEWGGFHLANDAAQRIWKTSTSKARFVANALPGDLIAELAEKTGQKADLVLQTMRSHDQYNTTIYGLDDRYRGVYGTREVLFVNPADIASLGYKPGDRVDIVSIWLDQKDRRVFGFTLVAYDLPRGQAAAYYPETNPLVPLDSFGSRTYTPTSKSIAIRLLPTTQQTNEQLIPCVSA